MPTDATIRIGVLKAGEVAEAERIVRLAFGTFLGLPKPMEVMADRDFMTSRWRASHTQVVAARQNGRLIGSNVVTRWGTFGFFGPLTVLPEYWDRGVATRLLEATMKVFAKWGLRRTGLCTFPHSAKHVGLYQKFGYWPRHLTAIMTRTPGPAPMAAKAADAPLLLSSFDKDRRKTMLDACRRLTGTIDRGLDLTGEIQSALAQQTGDIVLTSSRGILDAFAVCLHGVGSEGGEKTCYIKFAAARGGAGAGKRFDALLDDCETFARLRGANIEAGVNLARVDAFRRMRGRGYDVTTQSVAMLRPNADGHNRDDAYVIDDWR